MRPATLYRLATLGALLVVLGNVALAGSALRRLLVAERGLSRVLEVTTANEEGFAQIASASNAARGFLLTGQPNFLSRYEDSAQAARADLAELTALTLENESERTRLHVLHERTEARFAALDRALSFRSEHPQTPLPEELLRPALTETPADGSSIRNLVKDVREEQQQLLGFRTEASRRSRRGVIASLVGATVLDVVLILLASRLLGRAAERQAELDRRAAEVASLNSELRQLNAGLEARVRERTRELHESNQELEAFSYSVSHDLRAPLRTIDGFSLALEEDFAGVLNEEGLDYLRRVRSGTQRMGVLIDALLQLSRVTRGELTRETVDIAQLARGVFLELEAGAPERSVRWSAPASLPVEADPRLLRITLENLLGNAWKFTSRTSDAHLELGSFRRNEETVYYVRDNGAGFDMKYVDRLFTAFQRLHGDREFKGSGIGLATVSRIIRRHRGAIWAESAVGAGATFFFTLQPASGLPAVVASALPDVATEARAML